MPLGLRHGPLFMLWIDSLVEDFHFSQNWTLTGDILSMESSPELLDHRVVAPLDMQDGRNIDLASHLGSVDNTIIQAHLIFQQMRVEVDLKFY